MYENWADRNWEAGTEVEVFDLENKFINFGVLCNMYSPDFSFDDSVVNIQLKDGSVVNSSECHWLPSVVAHEVREKLDKKELKDYAINVDVKNFGGLRLEVNVVAENPDDAVAKATEIDPHYDDNDPYCLLVLVGEEFSIYCTYPNLNEASIHVKTIRRGIWVLVKRDKEDKSEGTIIMSSKN